MSHYKPVYEAIRAKLAAETNLRKGRAVEAWIAAERESVQCEVNRQRGQLAFAYLLRSIPNRRRLREICHKVTAVWAAAGTSEPMSIPEIYARYEKLPKGEA